MARISKRGRWEACTDEMYMKCIDGGHLLWVTETPGYYHAMMFEERFSWPNEQLPATVNQAEWVAVDAGVCTCRMEQDGECWHIKLARDFEMWQRGEMPPSQPKPQRRANR